MLSATRQNEVKSTNLAESIDCQLTDYAVHLLTWQPVPLTNVALPVCLSVCELCEKGSLYSITECRVLELILVIGSQPAGNVNHKPSGRLPLLSTRPAVTPATLKRAATNFAAGWTEARWVWTVCLRLLPDSVVAAIWTRAFCAWVQHANHSATEPLCVYLCPSVSLWLVNHLLSW